MKGKVAFWFVGLFLGLLVGMFNFSLVKAEDLDLGDPQSWAFYGRVFPGEEGFLLGGMEDDGHVQVCRPSWLGGPPYNFAVLKRAFRGPFEIEFRAQIFDTDTGFNAIYLGCADPQAFQAPEGCASDIPGIVAAPFEFILGNAWNQPEDGKVCVSLGTGHYDWTCTASDGSSFNAGEFHDFKIKLTEENEMQVFIDDKLLKSAHVEPCSTGYYWLIVRAYDGQVDFLDGELEFSENNDVEDNGTQQCADYQAGFEAGKRWCQEHPVECGIQPPGDNCMARVTSIPDPHNPFATQLKLELPCVDVFGEIYGATLGIHVEENTGRVWFSLDTPPHRVNHH